MLIGRMTLEIRATSGNVGGPAFLIQRTSTLFTTTIAQTSREDSHTTRLLERHRSYDDVVELEHVIQDQHTLLEQLVFDFLD
jgi:hypothetical protein